MGLMVIKTDGVIVDRVWLGWGELGNRKAQLQAEQDE
jgi:hypothetical protein